MHISNYLFAVLCDAETFRELSPAPSQKQLKVQNQMFLCFVIKSLSKPSGCSTMTSTISENSISNCTSRRKCQQTVKRLKPVKAQLNLYLLCVFKNDSKSVSISGK